MARKLRHHPGCTTYESAPCTCDPPYPMEREDTSTGQAEAGLDLDAIEARYTAEEIPPCRVCGAELSIQALGGGRPTVWACSTVNAGDQGWYEHYTGSKFEQLRLGDPEVLALVQEARIRQLVIDEGQEVLAEAMRYRDTVERCGKLLHHWAHIGRGDGLHAAQLREVLEGKR